MLHLNKMNNFSKQVKFLLNESAIFSDTDLKTVESYTSPYLDRAEIIYFIYRNIIGYWRNRISILSSDKLHAASKLIYGERYLNEPKKILIDVLNDSFEYIEQKIYENIYIYLKKKYKLSSLGDQMEGAVDAVSSFTMINRYKLREAVRSQSEYFFNELESFEKNFMSNSDEENIENFRMLFI